MWKECLRNKQNPELLVLPLLLSWRAGYQGPCRCWTDASHWATSLAVTLLAPKPLPEMWCAPSQSCWQGVYTAGLSAAQITPAQNQFCLKGSSTRACTRARAHTQQNPVKPWKNPQRQKRNEKNSQPKKSRTVIFKFKSTVNFWERDSLLVARNVENVPKSKLMWFVCLLFHVPIRLA